MGIGKNSEVVREQRKVYFKKMNSSYRLILLSSPSKYYARKHCLHALLLVPEKKEWGLLKGVVSIDFSFNK